MKPTEPVLIPGVDEFLAHVEALFAEEISAARAAIAAGTVTFEGLGELYGDAAVPLLGRTTLGGGARAAFMLTDSWYEERRSLVGPERSFHLVLEFVAPVGTHFAAIRFVEVLGGWSGGRARPVADFTYVPALAEEATAALALGRRCADLGLSRARFLAYAPHTFFMHAVVSPGRSGSVPLATNRGGLLPASGRVMIDVTRASAMGHHVSLGGDEATQALIATTNRYRRWAAAASLQSGSTGSNASGNTNSSGKTGTSGSGSDSLVLWERPPDELLTFCWPALSGFSFTAKAWGHVLVSGLGPVAFRTDAFEKLVLPLDQKQLIRALVRFGGEDNSLSADSTLSVCDGGQGTSTSPDEGGPRNPGARQRLAAAKLDDLVAGKRGGSVFLLHGPPGVGKTLTAEAIAELLGRPLYYVSMGELGLTPDDLERRLGDVLELCAGWNALALLDEADVFLETRRSDDLVRNAMVCVMLRLLEYHPGILFLTTNRIRTLDPAFESRVTVALRYRPLDAPARASVWRNLLSTLKVRIEHFAAKHETAWLITAVGLEWIPRR